MLDEFLERVPSSQVRLTPHAAALFERTAVQLDEILDRILIDNTRRMAAAGVAVEEQEQFGDEFARSAVRIRQTILAGVRSILAVERIH